MLEEEDFQFNLEFVDNINNNDNSNNIIDNNIVKLFKSSIKPLDTYYSYDLQVKRFNEIEKDRKQHLIYERECIESDIIKKRRLSSYAYNRLSSSKEEKERIRNNQLKMLQESIITFDDIKQFQKIKYSDKKGQIIYNNNNGNNNNCNNSNLSVEYNNKKCTDIVESQYDHVDLYLRKPLFDQIYEYSFINNSDNCSNSGNSDNSDNSGDKKENQETSSKENQVGSNESKELVEKKEETFDENGVYLYPYYPKAIVYNIVDDNPNYIIPHSNYNTKFKHFSTNIHVYSIYSNYLNHNNNHINSNSNNIDNKINTNFSIISVERFDNDGNIIENNNKSDSTNDINKNENLNNENNNSTNNSDNNNKDNSIKATNEDTISKKKLKKKKFFKRG